MQIIRKAVLPVAGLGTRFLPATKASPKEMLPIVDKPLVQYAVEEALQCGIKEFIFVTGRHKRAIEDHFDNIFELEQTLKEKGKVELLKEINTLAQLNCAYIRQGHPLGLGHAILRARPFVKDEPFAVLLSDDIIDPEESLLKEMIDVYKEKKATVIALEEVPQQELSRYGVIKGKPVRNGIYQIEDMVEKPSPQEAPSNLGIIGRYILTPDIFEALENIKPGAGGEYQLTDALKLLAKQKPVYGFVFHGRRYDAGDKFGFLQATVEIGLRHPAVAEKFKKYILDVAERLKN